jgi:hypothetical protein
LLSREASAVKGIESLRLWTRSQGEMTSCPRSVVLLCELFPLEFWLRL